MHQVLKREFPNGVNIVYESVGGEMFQTCMNSLAVFGRMVLIGMISQYAGETPAEGWKRGNYPGLCEKLLAKSQTLTGFYVNHYRKLFKEHIEKLYNLYSAGDLKITIDPTRFVGLNSVADAVEYLHSGHSIGKVYLFSHPLFKTFNDFHLMTCGYLWALSSTVRTSINLLIG
jgi:NADPH-dependent curcumin reductase CurA